MDSRTSSRITGRTLSRAGLAAVLAVVAVVGACGDDSSAETSSGNPGGTGAGSPTGPGSGAGSPSSGNTTQATSGASTGAETGSGAGTTGSGASTGSGGAPPSCPPAPGGAVPPLELVEVASGLDQPVFVTAAAGDTSRLYVVQQNGVIRLVKDGALVQAPFLDLQAIVKGPNDPGDEQGLLGLAFHPDYVNNGRFFLHFTDDGADQGVIVEYARAADPDQADPASASPILEVNETQQGNHNGGMIAFGPDGYLYIGFGDGGGSGDPDDNGQDIGSMLGKILRIDVDTYPAPVPGNLAGGNPHIWDYGLRNPWRFSFDRCSGDLYIGDVGQGAVEEIDVEPAGQGLRNYGWNTMEGSACFQPSSGCNTAGITLPTAEYSHDDGCSVSGGYVYRGSAIPALVGTYLYGDYCSNRVWSFRYEGGVATAQAELTGDLGSGSLGGLSSFGEDAAGELYVVDHGGTVYRIEAE